MDLYNPIEIVERFNECINNQDIEGLSNLMSDDHVFIDRDGSSHGPKSFMVEGWKDFFKMFPEYKNTFEKIKIYNDRVVVLGFAYWSKKEPCDRVIWSALIKGSLITEWRIDVDTPENRKRFNIF